MTKKAKLKVGEVAFYKTREVYVKVVSGFDSEGHCTIEWFPSDALRDYEDWCHRSELRPLSRRERGQ